MGGLGDYSGGTGTMANGIVENTENAIQLFDDRVNAVITVYLDGLYSINTISIFGGNTTNNFVPGEIDGIDVTINGSTETLLGAGFGTPNLAGTPRNDLFSVTGTALDGQVASQITYSMFFEDGCCNDYSIAEIEIDGQLQQVPEPTTILLLALSLAGLGFTRRRLPASAF